MGSSIRLGKIFGIPVGVSYSWFFIFAFITYSLAQWSEDFQDWSTPARWIGALVISALFFASVLAHELAHAVLARRKGIPVKEITLFFFGGVSQITEEAKKPSTELMIGGIGPLLSLVLGLAAVGIYFLANGRSEHVATGAKLMAQLNLALAVFNMIPGFPLDGGRVFRAVVWSITRNYYKATRIAAVAGRVIGYLMILGGVLAAVLTGALFQGVWIALVGWFLASAAAANHQQLKLRESLKGRSARDLMEYNCPTVPGDITVAALVDNYMVPTGMRLFVVGDLVAPEGVVSVRTIRMLDKNSWARTVVRNVMRPIDSVKTVEPGEDAFHVLEVMEQAEVSDIPVKYDGRIVGVIGRDSILRFLRTHSDLGM